ncbi:MAG TPA: NAD(P)H-hydrate dehydratase [Pirellulales bacterium]|nr:NAD(P)H-hydrate dehydratase [Pirellulales bacterium]
MPLPQLPPREPESHKGDFGRALLIGGSRGMTGAIALAGLSALRGGAGLVQLAIAETSLDVVASFEPSYMTAPLAADDQGRIAEQALGALEQLAGRATAVGCGPGLGRSPGLTRLVAWLYEHLPLPVVFDADALNALAEQPDILVRHAGPRILTPHPGEFQRLTGGKKLLLRQQSELAATELAAHSQIVVVLKGHRTFITDGKQQAHNETGNPGMATGGTGDVLTGLIAALVCQKLSPFDAARLGVHLHGLAGDLAAEDLGQVSLIASDLVRYLPAAFQQHAAGSSATRMSGFGR